MAGEKPAARMTDMHTCPESDGPVPHVGGPILTGSPNVLIGGLPAARVTDKVTCVGPPDMVAVGSPTVLINGLPAARMGDQTAHGGVIVGGLGTVLIGTAAGPASPLSSQGGALAQAAQDGGTPFCEKCTK
ncbi:MAG: type VI secretion protein [Acidiphilium sp. 34-60-192]|nr:MAG: type VI secretion protein [Acidiphilium sp. 34-60-192]